MSNIDENKEVMLEEEDDIIELTDENGETSQFEHLMTFEHEGSEYVALMLLEDEKDEQEDEEAEVIILKVEEDEQGDIFTSVDDDELADTLFEKFQKLLDEQFEDEE